MANKRIDFEVERGRLASSAMLKFKDIFMKLGVVSTEVKDGIRSYKIEKSINYLNNEDFENALVGINERTVDGLYDAYVEMREGEFDALWEPEDFSAAEKASGHDRTYNKNADEQVREDVSLTEVLSSFIEFFEAGNIAKELQNMDRNLENKEPKIERVNLEEIRRVQAKMEGKTTQAVESPKEKESVREPIKSQAATEMDNVKKSLEMHDFEVERGSRVKMNMIKHKDFFMQLGMLEKETNGGLTSYVVTDRVPSPEEIKAALMGLDNKTVESIYKSYAEIIQGGIDALWNKNDFTQEEKNNSFDLDYNIDAVDRIKESMSMEDIIKDMSDFYGTSKNSRELREMDRKIVKDMEEQARKSSESENSGSESESSGLERE